MYIAIANERLVVIYPANQDQSHSIMPAFSAQPHGLPSRIPYTFNGKIIHSTYL